MRGAGRGRSVVFMTRAGVRSRFAAALVVFALLAACAAESSGGGGKSEFAAPKAVKGLELLGQDVVPDDTPDATGADVHSTAGASTQFALDVYRRVAADAADKNVILSPYSLFRLLAMIEAGAKGTTAEEIRRVLHSDLAGNRLADALNRLGQEVLSRQNEKVSLRVADGAFVHPGLEPSAAFVEVLAREFKAPVARVDFGDPDTARGVINEWGKVNTNGLVPEAIPQGRITPQTRLVLADAVALDAAWETPFDPKSSEDGPFMRPDGSMVQARMMANDGSLPRSFKDGLGVVRLPYAGEDLSMIAIMPMRTPLNEFVAALTPEKLDAVVQSIEEGGIHLSFPKFTARSAHALGGTLQALGMPTAFSSAADFSAISPGLVLDFVDQGAFVEVDEKGTKAAAVSSGGFAASHGPTLSFNRPFMYLIRDDATRTVLFVGHVVDPSAKD